MLESFLTFINQQKLGLSEKSTLLTVSGGVDSVVLAHLFYTAGFSAGIAHCNFGLRNDESDGDELFVRQLAEQYHFPVLVIRFDTLMFAAQRGISTQMAARKLRYQWFEEIRDEKKYDLIATAHHANDAFETVLLNLTRGTGLAGLHGIAVKNNHIIRPLLFASKEEILQYAEEHQLVFREDSSNESNYYKRNLIRHEVIPVLKTMNPSLEKTFMITAQRLKSAETLLDSFLESWKKEAVKYVDGSVLISMDAILDSSEPVYRLWFILKDYGFNYVQAEGIIRSSDGLSGKIFQSGSHEVLKDRNAFIISERKNEVNNEVLVINQPNGKFQTDKVFITLTTAIKDNEFSIDKRADKACFDLHELTFPLTIRSWKSGDSFRPLGMGGKSKKISDLLIDLKLNLNQKQEVKVLLNGNGDVIWVIGLRTDEYYKVKDHTKEVLIVNQTKENSKPEI